MRVGFPGYRGMVGSVLVERMLQEGDFAAGIDPVFMSTHQDLIGSEVSIIKGETHIVADARDLAVLRDLDAVVACQGSNYTKQIHPRLRDSGWDGYWIDASSALRMADTSVLLLDPVNGDQIDKALNNGVKDLIGATCASGLMLMGLGGLFKNGAVEWANPDTYQAASGAGAKHVIELLKQMQALSLATTDMLDNPAASLTSIDRRVSEAMHSPSFPTEQFGYPLAGNILPWIDTEVGNGQSREEWKAAAETNKILGMTQQPIGVDGICVRVGSMRSHGQAVTIKLKQDTPLDELEHMISSAHEWVKLVPNKRTATLEELTPAAVSGTLDIAVGRVRKLNVSPGSSDYLLSAFVVGDQLLWGAAEPLRRALRILTNRS